jgi:hypothetical protein
MHTCVRLEFKLGDGSFKLVELKRTYAEEGRKISTNEENWTTMTIEEKVEVPESSGESSHKAMTMQRMLNQHSPYYY